MSNSLVSPASRHLYGLKEMAMVASSHPSDAACLCPPHRQNTFAVRKSIFVIRAAEKDEVDAYENKHDEIVRCIQAAVPGASWVLHVIRMGFDPVAENNLITILLVVGFEWALSDDAACAIVSDIRTVIDEDPVMQS